MKDEIEATKRIKILEPSPLTLLPFLSFTLPKKNKPGDFKGKAFLFPENWDIFKVIQSTLGLGSHLSWEMQDGTGLSLCPRADTAWGAHCAAGPPKLSQEPPGSRAAESWFPLPPAQHIFPPSPAKQLSAHLANTFPLSNFNRL